MAAATEPLKTRMKQADINRLYSILHRIEKASQLSGLRYWISAGTALGAVRHGGLIPWDDDGDIYILEPEFHASALLFYRALNIFGLHISPQVMKGETSDAWFKIFDDVSRFPNVDVFLLKMKDGAWRLSDPTAYRIWKNEYLLPDEVASTQYVPFGPLRLPIFSHTERYFTRSYGADWATMYYEGWDHEEEKPRESKKVPLLDRRPALPTISFH